MKPNRQKGIDYSKIIIWAAALVGMVRYSAAFLSSDLGIITGVLSEFVTICLGISGFAMGILGTLGLTYIFDGWRQKMPATGNKWSNKFITLTAFIILAFVAEVVILVPFTMSRVLHVSVADVLHGGVWWWSAAVVVMPLLLIGGVAVGNQIVTITDTQKVSEQPESLQKVSQKVSEPTTWIHLKKTLRHDEIIAISKMQTDDICHKYNVSPRTATNWRNNAKTEIKKEKVTK